MKKTGAEIFVESLKQEGVKVVFGIPGGVVLKIFDVLHQQKDVEVILTRHEQGAAHMAEGYAKATGKPGVVLVTSGPGMTNIVTGLTDAFMDSVPVVAFTGQVSTHLIGNDAFQEADNVGISRPCTKHNVLVKDVNDLALAIKEAFYIASTGRPGPVLVDIPKDVSINKADFKYPDKVAVRGYNPTYEGRTVVGNLGPIDLKIHLPGVAGRTMEPDHQLSDARSGPVLRNGKGARGLGLGCGAIVIVDWQRFITRVNDR